MLFHAEMMTSIPSLSGRYNGSLPNGDRGRRKSRFALYRRAKANGVKPSTVHILNSPQASKVSAARAREGASPGQGGREGGREALPTGRIGYPNPPPPGIGYKSPRSLVRGGGRRGAPEQVKPFLSVCSSVSPCQEQSPEQNKTSVSWHSFILVA